MNKLKSRKFWMSVAAFLASIGASIAGIATDNKAITVTGIICTMLSSAIYAAAEAYADGNRPIEQAKCDCEIDTSKNIL